MGDDELERGVLIVRPIGRIASVAAAIGLSLVAFSSCSNDPTLSNNGDTSGAGLHFTQFDRLGKPGIKELFLPYATHDAFDRASPINDQAAYGPTMSTFLTTTAGRSTAVSTYVQALLLPDVLVTNLTSTATTATYLGWETGGRLTTSCNGAAATAFGGRSVYDDVTDITLGLAFGTLSTTASTATTLATPGIAAAIAPDDGKEQNGANGGVQLASDNVTCTGAGAGPTPAVAFPYLAAPI